MLSKFWISLLLLNVIVYTNEAYNILIVFPFPGISHNILGNGYVKHILDAGHDVTYITPYIHPMKETSPKLRQIRIDYPENIMPKVFLNFTKLLSKEMDIANVSQSGHWFHQLSSFLLNTEDVQNLIHDPNQKFDLVIVEWLFTEIYSGFSALFKCPLIWASSLDPHWMILRLIDEAPNPTYLSDIMSHHVPPLTFTQRVQELWIRIRLTISTMLFEPNNDRLYEEIFNTAAKKRGIEIPSLQEVKYNASFVLSFSHISFGESVRLPQNFIPIGGYHIDSTTKPLPQDLQKIMDNAEHGVIYFSLGSNLKSNELPDKMKRQFLETFSHFKQIVIWKFEEILPDLPKNVHMLKWAPQQSILDHPNCVLFITHGGLLSTTETVHFGVPIIGVPIFADQFVNIERAVGRGIGKKVEFSYDTPKYLKGAIEEVLNDPSYRERVKYLSMVYHDRPVPPSKELVHWVEHAIKTRGAPHFRSRALMTPCYQKMYLDLAALLAVAVLILYLILKKIITLYYMQKRIQHKKLN